MNSFSSDSSYIKKQVMNNWDLINRLSAKRFTRDVIAEEAVLFVMDELEKNNWKRLKQFSGKSKFSTYLSSVVYRLLEDFSRKRFGRKTAPGWLTKLGGLWITLYRLLCLERFPYDDAVHLTKDKKGNLSIKNIEKAAEHILGEITDCGSEQIEVTHSNLQESVLGERKNTSEENERSKIINALANTLFDNKEASSKHIITKIIDNKITLKDQEKLLLKLCYQDNLSVTNAGKLLGLNRFQAHGRLKRLLKKIHQQLTDAGLEKEISSLLK